METKIKRPKARQGLRERAEQLCRASDGSPLGVPTDVSPEAMRQTLHELRVHQIELTMQNEELRRAQIELDAERERFFEKFATLGKRFGTGLGTYSAQKMIEAQGGSIAMRTCDEKDETILVIRMPV